MKTEEQHAQAMIDLVKKAKKDIGDEKTLGFLFGVALGEVLEKGGSVADAHAFVDATWQQFAALKAKEEGG